jgi:hypothetical protein
MKATISSECHAKRPLFCRFHGDAKKGAYDQRIANRLETAKKELDKALNSGSTIEALEAKEWLEEAEVAYASTLEGEEALRNEIDAADGLERDVLQARLDQALLERSQKEAEDDEDGVYNFPSSKLAAALEKIEKANRKLRKDNMEGEFTYDLTTFIRKDKDGFSYEMTRLELNRPPVAIAGWNFVASVDKAPDNQFVTRVLPGQELNGYRPEHQECDHCGSTRRRNSTYLLRSPDGIYKQVGSNCLESFLGVKPKGMWALNYDPEEKDMFDDSEDRRGGGPVADRVMPLEDTIAMALAVSDDGTSFVSKSKAYEYGGISTAEKVSDAFYSTNKNAWVDPEPFRAKAKEIIRDTTFEGDSDYSTNMRTILSGEWVSNKHMGLAISAVGSYQRQKFFNERKVAPKAVGYIGQVKDKIKDVSVTVKRVDNYPNDYSPNGGLISRLIMTTDDGKEVKWQASSMQDVREGDKLLLTGGTVKGHGEFNGNEQTILTRMKYIQVKDNADD